MKGLGRRVEEKARKEAGDERGGPRPTGRGVRDGEGEEETAWTGSAARHD